MCKPSKFDTHSSKPLLFRQKVQIKEEKKKTFVRMPTHNLFYFFHFGEISPPKKNPCLWLFQGGYSLLLIFDKESRNQQPRIRNLIQSEF